MDHQVVTSYIKAIPEKSYEAGKNDACISNTTEWFTEAIVAFIENVKNHLNVFKMELKNKIYELKKNEHKLRFQINKIKEIELELTRINDLLNSIKSYEQELNTQKGIYKLIKCNYTKGFKAKKTDNKK